jgi:cytochrome c biogenesis protein CcmG/thiol:disulfide interchange protein DsbE
MQKLVVCFAAALVCGVLHAAAPGETIDPTVLVRLQADPARFTVVDFFAEWCISCRKELPLVSALHGRTDKKKVDFVGVDTDDTAKAAEAFQKEMRDKGALTFRVVNDPEQVLVKSFKPKGYPALYILKDGKVVREHLGAMPNVDAVLEKDLKELGAL